jgi:Tfp pilus assembly protein PilF
MSPTKSYKPTQIGSIGQSSCTQASTTIRTRKATPQESFDKAKFFAKRGQYTDAAEELGKAVKLDAKFAEAYYFRSLVFSEIGFEHRSKSDLRRARELGFNVVTLILKLLACWHQAFSERD